MHALRHVLRISLFGSLLAGLPFVAQAQGVAPVTLKVYSAGSLKAAWTDLAQAYERASGNKVVFEFGASGLLRERLEKGADGSERADLFTSADTGHPRTLADKGLSGPMRAFTGNRLCAIAQPELGLTSANMLDKLLDPAVRVASSTPKADPSGDYTWEMFERAEKIKPGAFKTLSTKAMQLVGGPNSPPAPKDRTAYGKFMEDRVADVFIAYCTNGVLAQREVPRLVTVQLPETLSVTATYGMVLMRGAQPAAGGLADFLVSGEGQKILAGHGFAPLK
jgi:molybdenum ABC transporter molybdate-binding protein